jgi:signal transduction histidine kinase
LRLSQQTLRSAQDNLEIMVRERTAELTRVNEDLESEIAERMRSEAEKTRLQEQLLQTQKMEAIGILAGGIAHDFNNILSAIVGYASLLKKKMPADDPLLFNTTQILAASERAAGLVKGLLAFSRKQVVVLRPLDLNDIVRGFQNILGRIIGEDIEVRLQCSPARLLIKADRGQIEQVLMNLATNARDAMPQGGALHIATEQITLEADRGDVKQGSYALLSVSDNGTGIDPVSRAHVFEPFYTTKEVGKGTGLGLSIAYGIVRTHGGSIDVSSEPDRGTAVKIYLPLTEMQEGRTPHAHQAPPPSGTETLLLAEDEDLVREATRAILTDHGYTVIEAVDGYDAVRKFREAADRVQLVLCDIVMPRMNGLEACREIKKLRPDVKTIFMSGYTGDIIAQQGITEDGASFLAKPLTPHELLTRIRTVLDQ